MKGGGGVVGGGVGGNQKLRVDFKSKRWSIYYVKSNIYAK